jgi:5'-nucleotidase
MRILLTNDDGIGSKGLVVLENIARTLSDDIWVVAPHSDQSGMSHSLTLSHPLRVHKRDDRHFSVTGTPTDCVIMALRGIMPLEPDLILSGINHGHNIGDDVTYSGTVACAMEGTMNGIRSIALSQSYHWDNQDGLSFDVAENFAPDLLKRLIALYLPHVFLSINFPNCAVSDVKGTRITVQGRGNHSLHVEKRCDTRAQFYHWISFGDATQTPNIDSDVQALLDNKISITPLSVDLTAHNVRSALMQVLL